MHADTITTWSGLHPDTPHQCVSAQCGFRFSSASSSIRSLRSVIDLRRADHLSHVVGDPGVVLLGMSRQIAPQTRSKALRRTKRVLDARQGMEGAKNAYRGSQEVKRADTPNQGLSGRQEPRQPPAKPICTEQAAMRLVGGRRPSVLQRWGSGVLPRRFPVALKALPEPWRLGFFLENGEQKHAKDFEAAKRAMQDRQSWSER
ncbi:Uncharacterised protein [Shigella flexneri]|nr:Uncharacterised protein [Shigella flexneri]